MKLLYFLLASLKCLRGSFYLLYLNPFLTLFILSLKESFEYRKEITS